MMIVSYNGGYSVTTTYCPDLEVQHTPFSTYIERALNDIVKGMEEEKSIKVEDADSSRNGIIEDVVGLVNNLLTFGQRESEKEQH